MGVFIPIADNKIVILRSPLSDRGLFFSFFFDYAWTADPENTSIKAFSLLGKYFLSTLFKNDRLMWNILYDVINCLDDLLDILNNFLKRRAFPNIKNPYFFFVLERIFIEASHRWCIKSCMRVRVAESVWY